MDSQTSVRLLLIIIVALVLFVLVAYYTRNKSRLESEMFFTGGLDDAKSGGTASKKHASKTRMERRAELEDDLDDDVDIDEDIHLRSKAHGKKAQFAREDAGDYLINRGSGRFAPADFENATRAKTLEEKKEAVASSSSLEQSERHPDESNTVRVAGGVAPYEPEDDEQYRPVDAKDSASAGSNTVGGAYPGDRLKIDDLLPKDAANTTWAMVNPAGQGDVKDQNFLTAGYLQGLQTKGQTNRNPNMQLRSEPPNPRHATGIWMQSTMEPDTFRRPFEVGGI